MLKHRRNGLFGLILLVSLSACNGANRDSNPANESSTVAEPAHYEATAESLAQHPLPRWWDEGKFGIFIHWGVYAVPGRGGREGASPYTAEWYWFAQNIAGPFSEAWQYHLDTYGPDFLYDDFIPQFQAENFDPDAWVALFEAAGARYFVMTAKHHDGFALWPSDTTQRDSMDQGPNRDLVGELFAASHRAGDRVKPGLYYSIPEWLNPAPYPLDASLFYTNPNTPDPFPGLALLAFNGQFTPRNAYTQIPVPYTGYQDIDDYAADHVRPQLRELISRYSPSVIWCDIGGAESYFRSNEVIADYYNHALAQIPQGVVVNDRCGDPTTHRDYAVSEVSGVSEGEDVAGRSETVQTMGFSWGYDQEESDTDMRSVDELVDLLVDTVANNGNLLLNIGPRADGSIPQWQVERLLGIGQWLELNGDAIYSTQPWEPNSQGALRFTQAANGDIYAIALEWPGEELRLPTSIAPQGEPQIELLGSQQGSLPVQLEAEEWVVSLPAGGPEQATRSQFAFAFRVRAGN